ncbi:MAG: hypothetical protein J6K21_00515 [Bacilli bacterium]|nr:hypothetical protein [Bacilli bacterium]
MLDEFYIWQKIFEESNNIEMYNLIKLVIFDNQTREYVYNKILELKENKIKLDINIDKEMKDYPITLLANEIVDKLISKIKKEY